ncbi:hypothetical protein SSBR45G_17000 [Bradyrhizobium sp. SSBR45G]|uniref:hypothetical protein n=1 Tax=unclassified Bradyrhizobium TaxID=2631580 RepID=UPI002342A733|nr:MULTISPECIES: hypothetical protein [unclassified Bradyrhizobium]GLH76792.1 hypothetical protein SSBR45G_17000 [Bradyrhizobium sp. SSBR45G]GLH83550.1 hypothetical protein SSBR45R_10100 [Bradyrhizobium sp. SSBR45R]
MTTSIRLFAAAAIVATAGLLASASTSPASAGWEWLGNKNYINCLQLFASGNFLIPANATPAQRAAKHEAGRRYCNRQYYGHD